MVIGCITFSTGITTFLAGVVTIAIPVMAKDLGIPESLILWYVPCKKAKILCRMRSTHLCIDDVDLADILLVSVYRPVTVYSLTCGCTLLVCGSISDVIGSRKTFLSGCFLQCVFTLACGLSHNSAQIIAFRACSGVAASFCLPSAVSLINEVFPSGRSRNAAFASMGGAQPVCFGVGLVLGGILAGTIGWQWGFYIAAVINFAMLLVSAWQLPKNDNATNASQHTWSRLLSDIDWIGVLFVSTFLALLSYVIA